MSAFTSNSNNACIAKCVLDVEYFRKLKKAKDEYDKLHEKEKKKFENVPAQSQIEQHNDIEQSGNSSCDNEQFGAGLHSRKVEEKNHHSSSSNWLTEEKLRRILKEETKAELKELIKEANWLTEEKFRRILKEETKAELKEYFRKPPQTLVDHLKNIKIGDIAKHIPVLNTLGTMFSAFGRGEQHGGGGVDYDILPNVIPTRDDVFMHSNERGISQPKPNTINYARFLRPIPEKFRCAAKELLQYLENHASDIRWNHKFNVTVDNEFIPQSNIYKIFGELYNSRPDLRVPGYVKVASHLMNAGLGRLLRKHPDFWFTSRPRSQHWKKLKKIPKTQPWFYIGD